MPSILDLEIILRNNINMKYKLISLSVIGVLFFAIFSCNRNNESDEKELDSMNSDLLITEQNFDSMATYITTEPGEGGKFARAFENAPPLIPHTTEGFFPIKRDNNICLSCHMPNLVVASGAVAIPESHFTNLRPQPVLEGEVYSVTSELLIDFNKKMDNQYFNCSQCHVPQTTVKVDIRNKFTPEFRSKYVVEGSNLDERLKEGL
jgi:cytochrome c-type protein NapB